MNYRPTFLLQKTRSPATMRNRRYMVVVFALIALVIGVLARPVGAATIRTLPFALEAQSLDGSGNNQARPTQGQIGQPYSRVGPAAYADGRSAPVAGPNTRFISNRLINDASQNVFSENGVTQWLWTWGQFLDHTVGLAQGGTTADAADIPFNQADPLENFQNNLGVIPFTRDAAVPG
ncbi:MAG: peroxidase, partial [Micromonosporaceae bacterium]|nr:peroxidase [Micromonosporaceae bacterium]